MRSSTLRRLGAVLAGLVLVAVVLGLVPVAAALVAVALGLLARTSFSLRSALRSIEPAGRAHGWHRAVRHGR